MISYRQADIRDKLKDTKTADIFDVTFRYDENYEDASRFYFYSIDQTYDGISSRDDKKTKWDYIHDLIPMIIERERVYLHPMDMQNAQILFGYIVNTLKASGEIKDVQKLNQEVLQEPFDVNGRETGQKRVIKYTARIFI